MFSMALFGFAYKNKPWCENDLYTILNKLCVSHNCHFHHDQYFWTIKVFFFFFKIWCYKEMPLWDVIMWRKQKNLAKYYFYVSFPVKLKFWYIMQIVWQLIVCIWNTQNASYKINHSKTNELAILVQNVWTLISTT